MPADSKPVPQAVAAQAAHQFGKDVVIILALSHEHGTSHATVYGKTESDQRIGERLVAVIGELMAGQAKQKREAA